MVVLMIAVFIVVSRLGVWDAGMDGSDDSGVAALRDESTGTIPVATTTTVKETSVVPITSAVPTTSKAPTESTVVPNTNRPDTASPSLNLVAARTAFVPFPHRLVGLGMQLQCGWKTSTTMLVPGDYHQIRIPPPRNDEPMRLDIVQKRALQEGICLFPDKSRTVRLFSREQAQQCLANKTLLFAGHSEIADVFVGLADILLNGQDFVSTAMVRSGNATAAQETLLSTTRQVSRNG